MANNNSVVTRVGLDDSGFQKGIGNISRGLKLIQSEFAEASSKLGNFGKGTDGLRLKADTLSRQLELQKEKVKALTDSYNESVEKKGADAKATENLKIKLNYANAELNKMQSELKQTTKELNTKSSAWYKMGQAMDSASTKLKSVGDKMTSIGKTLTATVTAPIIGAGIASVKLASDVSESMNKVEVAFGDSANSVKEWSNSTLKAYGIARGTALDMSSLFGDMATSMGLSTQEASKMSMSLVGLAGDLSSFKNINIKEAETALNGIFTGETESLKRLGVVMTEINLKQFALSKGISKNYQDMTEAEKVQLRYNFVMEKSKNALGDFERTGGGTANQMRIFQESLKELGATMGEQLLPVITPIITKVNEWIQSFSKLDDGTKKVILIIAGIAAVLPPVILVIGSLISAVGTIIGVFGAASTAIAAAGGIIAVLTGPIGIAIAAVAALIAIGVLVVKNWDSVKSFFAGLWTWLKGFFSEWGGTILRVVFPFLNIPTAIVEAWKNISGFFENLKNSIKQKLKDMFNFELPHIKLPHFKINGSFSLNPPSIPSIGVNWYDKGGIFNAPTVIGVGEKRSEFVGALDDLRYLIGDELDKRIGNSTGDNTTRHIYVTVELDKKVVGRTVAKYVDEENGFRKL